jgi:16S rRNA G966 N2-methylase RsmD
MNMLAGRLAGSAWLDLFCGSGVMACEALQRGAARVVAAVDQDRRMVATARGNLAAVAQGQAARPAPLVVQREVLAWLRREAGPPQERGFDLIYADPPYGAGLYGDVAAAGGRRRLAAQRRSDALGMLQPGDP